MSRTGGSAAATAAGEVVTVLLTEPVPADAAGRIGSVERSELEGRLLWLRPRQEALVGVLLRVPELSRIDTADVTFPVGQRPTVDDLIALWGPPERIQPDDVNSAELLFVVTGADGRRVYVSAREPEDAGRIGKIGLVLAQP